VGLGCGVLKTTSGRGSWSAVSTGLPRTGVCVLAVDGTTSPSTVYAVLSGSGVFKTTNGGGSWSAVNNGLPKLLPSCGELPRCTDVSALAVDATTSPSTVYAGIESGGSVFKTRNGGGSWSPLNAGLKYGVSVECVAVDATTCPSTVYAGTAGGAFVFQNTCGATLPCPSVRCILEAATNDACAGQAIPASIRKNFDRAASLIEQSATRPPKQARKLRRRAKEALAHAKTEATRAAKGKKRKISTNCAAALRVAAKRVAAAL